MVALLTVDTVQCGRNKGGKAKGSSVGNRQAAKTQAERLARNRNTETTRNVMVGSTIFAKAQERGYSKQEASTLTKQAMAARRSGNMDRYNKLINPLFQDFTQ